MSVHVLLGEKGKWVSQEHRRVAEIINDYERELHLVFVPGFYREGLDDFQYALIHSAENLAPYIVRRVREQDMNAELLAWIAYNDSPDNLLGEIEAREMADKKMQEKVFAEEQAAAQEVATSILQGKNYYRHNGKVYA